MSVNDEQPFGVFVSDLHLFSRRSVGNERFAKLTESCHKAQTLVLGGDIFDFKWSTCGTHQQSIDAAQRWLEEVHNQWSGNILFLPGNHDCQPDFLDVLSNLTGQLDRFTWQAHHAQLDDCLFLHGDVLDAGCHLPSIERYRSRFHHRQPRSLMANRIYDLVVQLRVHRTIPNLRHNAAVTVRKLHGLLAELEEYPRRIRRVFFGHTHVRVDGFSRNGVQFFNPGAAIKHIDFRPVVFSIKTHPETEIQSHRKTLG